MGLIFNTIHRSNLIIYKFTKYINLILKMMKNYRTIGGAMVVVGGVVVTLVKKYFAVFQFFVILNLSIGGVVPLVKNVLLFFCFL
jgi:hypothetical protein